MAALVLVLGTLGTVALIDGANATTELDQGARAGRQPAARGGRGGALDPLLAARHRPRSSRRSRRPPQPARTGNRSSPGWTIKPPRTSPTASPPASARSTIAKDGTATHDAATFCATGAGTTTAQQCHDILGVDGSIQGAGTAASRQCVDRRLRHRPQPRRRRRQPACEASVDSACSACASRRPGRDLEPRRLQADRHARALGPWLGQAATRSRRARSPNPGLSAAPPLAEPRASSSSNESPITNAATTSIPFTAMAAQVPTTVAWLLDGNAEGDGERRRARPVDVHVEPRHRRLGHARCSTATTSSAPRPTTPSACTATPRPLTVHDQPPHPVRAHSGFAGGRSNGVVEFEWAPNKERDIVGYRVYRTTGGSAVGLRARPTADQLPGHRPPGGLFLNYYVVAVDRDSSGTLREGDALELDHGQHAQQRAQSARQGCPCRPRAAITTLTWNAAVIDDPDLGDSVAFYRIYRDGVAFADRYDRTASGTQLTYTDSHTGGTTHTLPRDARSTRSSPSRRRRAGDGMTGPSRRLRARRAASPSPSCSSGSRIFIVILGAVLLTFNTFEGRTRSSTTTATTPRTRRATRARPPGPRSAQPRQPDARAAAGGRQGDGVRHRLPDGRPDGAGAGLAEHDQRAPRALLPGQRHTRERGAVDAVADAGPPPRRPPCPRPPSCPDDGVGRRDDAPEGHGERDESDPMASPGPLFTFNSSDRDRDHPDTRSTSTSTSPRCGTRARRTSPQASSCATRTASQSRAFTWSTAGYAAGSKRVLLNGSASEDPEGDPLEYEWYDDGRRGGRHQAPYMGEDITCDCIAKGAGARADPAARLGPAGPGDRRRPRR